MGAGLDAAHSTSGSASARASDDRGRARSARPATGRRAGARSRCPVTRSARPPSRGRGPVAGEGDRLRADPPRRDGAPAGRDRRRGGGVDPRDRRRRRRDTAVDLPALRRQGRADPRRVRAALRGVRRGHRGSRRSTDDPVESLRRRGQAYVRFGLENPEQYRILFMTKQRERASNATIVVGAGARAFQHLVDAVQRVRRRRRVPTGRPGAGGDGRVGDRPRRHVVAHLACRASRGPTSRRSSTTSARSRSAA